MHEKGGKQHEMPAHHKLEAFLDEYIRAAGLGHGRPRKGLLFFAHGIALCHCQLLGRNSP